MFRQISSNFGGEYLGDVELGTRVMSELLFEEQMPFWALVRRVAVARGYLV